MNQIANMPRLLIVAMVMIGVLMYVFPADGVKTQSTNQQQIPPTLQVTYELKGKELHLQLKVTNFSFSLENMGKDNRYGEGHAHLYVNGKKVAKIFEERFTYAKLPPGKHQIEVELAHNNHDSYNVRQKFEINI